MRISIQQHGLSTYLNGIMADFLQYFACGSSLEGPAAVRQDTWAPLVLLPLFDIGNIFVKALPMLVTGDTKVFREEVQV